MDSMSPLSATTVVSDDDAVAGSPGSLLESKVLDGVLIHAED